MFAELVVAVKAAAVLVTSRVLLLFIAKVTEAAEVKVSETSKVSAKSVAVSLAAVTSIEASGAAEVSLNSSAVSLSKFTSIVSSEVAEAFLEVSEVAEVT